VTPLERFPFRSDFAAERALGLAHRLEERRPRAWRAGPDEAWRPWTPGLALPAAGLVLDFGEELVGHAELRFAATGDLTVRWGESEVEARCAESSTVRWYTAQVDRGPAATGRLVTAGRRAGRFAQLSGAEGRLDDAVWRLRLPDLPEPGAFACADPLLGRIWELCSRTTRLCMQDYYEDGLKRDGLLWLGDYRLQYLCNLGTHGDHALARRSLFMIAASQRDDGALPACAAHGGGQQHPQTIDCMPGVPAWHAQWVLYNYITDFVSALREYHWHSGDAAGVRMLIPTARRALVFLTRCIDPDRDDLGLHFYTFNDSADDPHRPRCALLGHLVWAGRDAAALGEALDDPDLAEAGRALAERWQGALAACWDPAAGLYTDAPGHARRSWHSQVAALLAGEAPDDPAAILARAATACGPPSQAAYIRFWTLEARFRHGHAQTALDDLRSQWGLFLRLGLTTCPEILHRDGAAIGVSRSPLSLCHGWSAAANALLPRQILGVQPTSPGWRTVRVRPQLADLDWAAGTVPTPLGPITVEARRGLAPHVTLPAGCRLEESP